MIEDKSKCPICSTTTQVEFITGKDSCKTNCPRCGLFEITDDAFIMFQRSTLQTKILSVSFWLRNHQSNSDKPILIELRKMRDLLSIPFVSPKPREQANNFILWLGNTVLKPNDSIQRQSITLIPVLGATDENGVYYILKHISNEGFIYCEELAKGLIPTAYRVQFTFKGWDRYYELQRSNKDSRLAFMAMKFGNETLVNIFNSIIKEAVSKAGFEIRRLDEERRAGLIDDKLRVEIRRSKFLIADLTDDNNGAYWEAGYAEGLGMPVIYICEEEKFNKNKSHFDTNHHLTIPWKNDKDGLKKFSEEIKATIRATFPLEAKMED